MSNVGLVCIVVLIALSAMTVLADGVSEDVHVVKWPKGTHGYRGSMGDMIQLRDGSVVMSYTERDSSIAGVKSEDQGKTWGAPFTLVSAVKPPAKGSICHSSFMRCKNGDLLLSYIYSTYPTTPYYGHNYYRRSADEGKTWTDQYVMTPYPGYVQAHNDRLFTLSTGRIVSVAEYKAHLPSTSDHSGYTGLAFFSDDDGFSWQSSTNTVDLYPMEVQEADAVELKDGRVMMFARTYSGHPVRAYSSDGCVTWSKGEEMKELEMPYAGLPTVRRLPSTGDLLFIWISGKSQDKNDPKINWRCTLSSAISKDEGKTFEHFRKVRHDPEDDFGYQCVEFLGDNLVLMGYHARDGLHVARIGTDWFYGKD